MQSASIIYKHKAYDSLEGLCCQLQDKAYNSVQVCVVNISTQSVRLVAGLCSWVQYTNRLIRWKVLVVTASVQKAYDSWQDLCCQLQYKAYDSLKGPCSRQQYTVLTQSV